MYYSLLFDIFLVKLLLGKPVKKGEDLPSRVWCSEILTVAFIVARNRKYIHLMHVLILKPHFVIFIMFVILLAESVVIMPAFGVQLETHYVR